MHFFKCLNFRSSKDSIIEEEKYEETIDDDCWEMIFKLVRDDDPDDFASISLVCKRFLSITNQMKTSLTVSDSTARHLPRALRRFRHIRTICIDASFHKNVDSLVCQISNSRPQHLEALEFLYPENFPREGLRELEMSTNGLKKFKCEGISLCDDDLIMLTELFPCLEELYMNCFKTYELVTDRGVQVLATKLKKLKKVTLCDCSVVTDEAIMSLSSNCKDLTGIEIQYCKCVTENGIGFLMQRSSKLTSLTLVLSSEQSFKNSESQFTMENSITYARYLEEIKLWGMDISDDFLCSIAKSCPSLEKIDMDPRAPGHNFTMRGLTTFFKACLPLKSFSLRASWLTDEYLFEMSDHLHGLTFINLRNCSSLTCATFIMLTQYCPLLESVVMDDTKLGFYEDVELVLHPNNRIKYLSMNSNEFINDRALLRFVLICPYLEYLDISNCKRNFTDEGIAEVLRVCPEIRHLNIAGLNVSNFLGSDNERTKLKLKTIQAESTLINDESLEVIGQRCSDLEEVNIGWCKSVTSDGVKLMVSKCEKLKKINMYGCMMVNINVLDLMMALRPSLKEIVSPHGFVPCEEQRNSFLAKGCLLLEGGHGGGMI